MERMTLTLRETVAKALAPYPDGLDYHRAEMVLAALGLDDLDAAVERMRGVLTDHWLLEDGTVRPVEWDRDTATAVLAAFFATEGPQDG